MCAEARAATEPGADAGGLKVGAGNVAIASHSRSRLGSPGSMNAGRVSPSVALAAYAEAWIHGAKVVVFGDALSLLAERLVERGARHVQVYDADAARAAEANAASTLKQVSYAPLDLAGIALRDGAFDVGIVEDLAVAGQNPSVLLSTLRRALSRRGLALICSRNPDVSERLISDRATGGSASGGGVSGGDVSGEQPLGYYDFYDAVSQHFEEVRMLGQTPFVGYAIADFSAADASEVRIDTALLPGGAEEPERFLALASALPVSTDAFSVIQLPLSELELGGDRRDAEPVAKEALERAELERAELERAAAKIDDLEAALAALAAEGAREAEKHAAERVRDAERFAAERARDAEKFAAERSREAEKFAAERARDSEKLAERSREAEKLAAERARDAEKVAERSRNGDRQSRDVEKRALEKAFGEKLSALQAELDKREEWLAGLESRAATADQRADEAQTELERRNVDLAKAKVQLTRLEHQLEEDRRAKRLVEDAARTHKQELEKLSRRAEADAQRANELAAESKKLSSRVAELNLALAESEKRIKLAAEEGDEDVRAELTQLEALLKERAAEVSRLTSALHETERFGRQLISKLSELEASREPAPASPEIDSLMRRIAELSADLEAARWTISSLEANVGDDPTASSAASPTSSSLSTPSPEVGSAAGGPRRDEIPPGEPLPLPRAD
jgi:hypothetical protein